MKRLVLLLAVVAAAIAVTAAYAAQSPKALRASILAAAKAQHSVHWDARVVAGGMYYTTGADVAADKGVQHVTFHLGRKTAHVAIRVVANTAYVEGDATGLEINLGLTKAQATKYAGKWISIPKGDKLYGPVSGGDTIGSLIQSMAPHGRLSVLSTKLHGSRVVGVRGVVGTGKKKTAEVLLARAHGKRLPVEAAVISPGRQLLGRTTLSKWNESVQVQAPSSSTPISTVRSG